MVGQAEAYRCRLMGVVSAAPMRWFSCGIRARPKRPRRPPVGRSDWIGSRRRTRYYRLVSPRLRHHAEPGPRSGVFNPMHAPGGALARRQCQRIVMPRTQPIASTTWDVHAGQVGLWPDRRGGEQAGAWMRAYGSVRAETERRAARLSAEDQIVQSMADASPTKWHRAHVTWFFEQFLLVSHAADYRRFDERFPFLFNSYYVAAGPRHARPQRGLITRPNGEEVARYRAHVDAAVHSLIHTSGGDAPIASSRFWRSGCITSSSTRNCCSPISCTPSRKIRPSRPTTRVPVAAARRPERVVRIARRHSRHRPSGPGVLLRQRDAAHRTLMAGRAPAAW